MSWQRPHYVACYVDLPLNRAFKIYDGYCCSWHCCGLLKLIHIASRQARHNKTVLSVSRGVNWIPDNSRLSVAEDSKAEHVQSHRPIHTRHDTDRTVLSCLAGSVNWALQAYSSTPVVTRASVADTRCMNVFYHVLELLFFTFFPSDVTRDRNFETDSKTETGTEISLWRPKWSRNSNVSVFSHVYKRLDA